MDISENNRSKNNFNLSIIICSFTALVLFMFKNTGIICDEKENYQQILNFSLGDYHLLEISAVPGYHACLALIFKISGLHSLFAGRFITAIIGCISVYVFYLISNRLNPTTSQIKTLQYFLFPSIFIYYFVLYTDILSLTLIMFMILFSLEKKYVVAGVFGIFSMLIRQNNVLWLAFIPALVYYELFLLSISINKISEVVRRTWVFFIGIALFTLFVIVNKGVAVGDSASHPTFQFSTGNLFFILFCSFVFFLPMNIANFSKIIKHVKTGATPILISSCLLIIYWLTFKNDHPYNNIATYYFIRNYILVAAIKSTLTKALFFIPILYSFWSLVVTPLTKKSWNLFYLFTIIFLIPSWLIEQRYYMIPFMLFMLFRKEQSLIIERITVVYYVSILCVLLPLIITLKKFL